MKQNPMVNYAEIVAETNSKQFNVCEEYKDNTYEQNVAICKADRLPFSVGAINITGELNVGMMIRSACLMGAENFYVFGRKKFDKRSTVGAEKYINIVQYVFDDPLRADESILDTLMDMKHEIVLCEHGGYRLKELNRRFWSKFANPLFLFGSESHGIPQVIIDAADPESGDGGFYKVSIPQFGVLRSFNVSAAMNIIIWDYCKEVFL